MSPTKHPDTAEAVDRDLRATGDRAALDAHRWQWTINPANPDAMSLSRYAKMTHQPLHKIRASVHAHDSEPPKPAGGATKKRSK